MLYATEPEGFQQGTEVVGCFLEHDGTIALLLRPPQKTGGGRWGMPAGKVEPGETLLAAMRRELAEETGLDIAEASFSHVDSSYVIHPERHFMFHTFTCRVLERPEIRLNPGEHLDACWVSPREALDLPLVRDLDEGIRIHYGL